MSGLSASIPLHRNADRFGPMLARFANGEIKQAAFSDGVVSGLVRYSPNDQATLIRWLDSLASPPKKVLREIASEVRKIKTKSGTGIVVDDTGAGIEVTVNLKFKLQRNLPVLAYMVASLIGAGMNDRLKRCPYCEQFFFDPPKAGPAQKYCSHEHANAARQRRHRERHAK